MKNKVFKFITMFIVFTLVLLSGFLVYGLTKNYTYETLLSEDFEEGSLAKSSFKSPLAKAWNDCYANNGEQINGKFSFTSPSDIKHFNIFLKTDSSKLYIGAQEEITVTFKAKILEPFDQGGQFYIEVNGGDNDFRYLRINGNGSLGECGAKGSDDGGFQDWYFYPTNKSFSRHLGDGVYFIKFTFTTSSLGYQIMFGINTGEAGCGKVAIDDINLYSGNVFNAPEKNIQTNYQQTGNENVGALGEGIMNRTENDARGDYHWEPLSGFNNDINGPIYYNGVYHVFYQYNVDVNGSGNKEWGHIISKDLVHWEDMPVALTYDEEYDKAGVWSGNAFLDKDGNPVIIYYANGVGICLAYPKDLSDPNLTEWVKEANNPIITKNDFQPETPYGVYDVSNVWYENDTYYLLTGNKDQNHKPMTYLFESKNLIDWNYVGEFIEPDSNLNDYDDFACQNLMLINEEEGIYLLTFTSHYLGVRYYTGKIVDNKFEIMHYGTFSNAAGVEMGSACCYDADGRVLYFVWPREYRTAQEYLESGWNGGLLMTRVITCDANGILTIKPHENYELLAHDEKSIEYALVSNESKRLDGFNSMCAKLSVDFVLDGANKAGVKVLTSPDGSEETLIYYDNISKQFVIDYTDSSLNTYDYTHFLAYFCEHIRSGVQKSLVFDVKEVHMDIYIDGSFLEVYINDQLTMSQRVYPSLKVSDCVEIFAEGGNAFFSKVSMWQMNEVKDGE